MLGKLALGNAKRSFRDYFIYLMTMVVITALMFSFDSMIFSDAIRRISEQAGMFGMMIGLATFFVVIIIVWLTHYMIRFMAEKRSREFATYLLLGFRKKQVARLFFRENMLIGAAAFGIGLAPGMFLQQIFTTAIYAMIQSDYQIRIEWSLPALAMTAGIYAGAYLLALFRNKRRFRKMTIQGMMNMERQNEEIRTGNKSGRQWMFWAALIFIGIFLWMMATDRFTGGNIYFFIIGLAVSAYFFYMGLAAFMVGYIKRKGKNVQKGANIFVHRQLASKIRTMQFTLGTLTVLFAVALMGASWSLMLNQYQNTQGDEKFPFDIAIYHPEADGDFRKEQKLIQQEVKVAEDYEYKIYENGTNEWNDYLYEHNGAASYDNAIDDGIYFDYDTYMKESDYNELRKMLGHEEIKLEEDSYLLQVKERLKGTLKPMTGKNISVGGKAYSCSEIQTIHFEQNGHNGADYILVLPDMAVEGMTPCYSVYAAMLKDEPPADLEDKLLELNGIDLDGDWSENPWLHAYGSDNIYVSNSPVYVRDIEIREMKFILTSLIFPLFYIGMVFLLVAVTVLAVQQLSDSAKYRNRYDVLRKLGMKKKEMNRVILKELSLYYLFPFAAAALLSGGIVGYISVIFITYSGVITPAWIYFAMALSLFGGIYLLYFAATYIGFKRNVCGE